MDRSRPFTRDDLLEAGDELGLNREVLEDAYHTYVIRKRDGSLRPQGTAVVLAIAADRLTLYVPGRGLGGFQLVRFVMGVLVLAFIAFWTSGALRGGLGFAALSLPGWMAAFYILFTAARSTWQKTRLELGREEAALSSNPSAARCSFALNSSSSPMVRGRNGHGVRTSPRCPAWSSSTAPAATTCSRASAKRSAVG